MASSGNETDEYLPDSDDSSDEYERPNRWAGPASTWQQLNGAEIDTLTALNEIRHRDLSVHLYNTFALKHRHNKEATRNVVRPEPNQDVDIATGQPVKEDKWVPPRSWVAWPLPADAVPHPQFLGQADGVNESFTSEVQSSYTPKTELEDAISSTILRFAKEKFRARQMALQNENVIQLESDSNDEEDHETNADSASSSVPPGQRLASKSRSVKYESSSDFEMMDIDDLYTSSRRSPVPPETTQLNTVVAADDELSYTLLRPSVRSILSNLDTTLTVLHNTQESRINCPTDSDTSDTASQFAIENSQPPRRGRKRNPRSRAPPPRKPLEEPTEGKKRVGRPRKIYPRLNGETDKAFAIRIARLQKKPIPYFSDDDAAPVSDPTLAQDSAAEHTDQKAKVKHKVQGARTKSRRSQHNDREDLSDTPSADEVCKKPRRNPRRERLRDWRDVLGAAALAGFPASALDRAARRCADLFDQKFTLHTLQEEAQGQVDLDKPMHYTPGMRIPSLLEDSEDGDDEMPSQSMSSHVPPAMNAAPDDSGAQDRESSPEVTLTGKSLSKRNWARRGHFCFIRSCPRSLEPFARLRNLVRHLRLRHNIQSNDIRSNELPDSEDEMHGAVHVDGFLKPIKLRRGWRGENVARGGRRLRRQPQIRAREIKTEVEDVEVQGMGVTSHREVSD
ncbi:RNA polymerase I-specific transcription initiation factor-domain-containing protein [Xylaria nigripes]|nr:RNA polymerase I-specific transcription initiation factor-domain-containing protein [Xylaria nigripes]